MNRKRHTNSVQVGSLLRWVVIAVFLGITGICYVFMSNQAQGIGSDNRKLENELHSYVAKNDGLKAKIAILSSYPELQRRLDEGFIKMQSITEDRIVRLNLPRSAPDEIRPVANGGMEK